MEIIQRELKDIKPYPQNAKKHPKKQIQQVADSISMFGFNQPIVLDTKGVIIVGHGRYCAAELLELKTVPTVTLDLDNDKAKAYRLADNKLNESEWVMSLVIDELKELEINNFDIEITGFDTDLLISADEKDDEVPEVPKTPKAKLGDIYQLGEHRVMCGDSTKLEDVELLMDGKKADMVFTDPPYGISYSGKGVQGDAKANDFGEIIGDGDERVAIDVYNLIQSLNIKDVVFWGANYYCNHLEPSMGWIVWDKKTVGDRYSDCELAWTNRKGRVMRLEHQWHGMIKASEHGQARVHPTQKPVFLAQWVFEKMNGGNKVLDLFLGSGSTLIAAEKTGRICYGMELDPKYIDVIIERWEEYTGNKANKIEESV